jgi:hypothetical protein
MSSIPVVAVGTATSLPPVRLVLAEGDVFDMPNVYDPPSYSAAQAGNLETIPRFGHVGSPAVSGQAWFVYFNPQADITIATLGASFADVASATPTLSRLGLYTASANDSLTLVARTANTTSLGSVTFSDVELALATTGGYPASYTLTKGTRYAIGYLGVAATAASLRVAGVTNASLAPVLCRRITGQADLATSYAVGTLTTHYDVPYFYATGV